jgi:hypothetical protein
LSIQGPKGARSIPTHWSEERCQGWFLGHASTLPSVASWNHVCGYFSTYGTASLLIQHNTTLMAAALNRSWSTALDTPHLIQRMDSTWATLREFESIVYSSSSWTQTLQAYNLLISQFPLAVCTQRPLHCTNIILWASVLYLLQKFFFF